MLAIFGYMCLDAIILGNNIQPQVTDRDQDKNNERDREEIILIKLYVID
jgi:hypothetical protein